MHGCTHLVELLGPVATTAFQTIDSDEAGEVRRAWEEREAGRKGEPWPPPASKGDGERAKRPPPVLNTCHAWRADGEVVERWAPHFFTGKRVEPAGA